MKTVEWNWTELAVFAYRSFLTEGRGVVLLGKEMSYVTDIESRFSNEDICEKIDLRSHLAAYDPNKEVVICFANGSCLLRSQKMYAGAVFTPQALHYLSFQGPPLSWDEEMMQIRSFRWTKKKRSA